MAQQMEAFASASDRSAQQQRALLAAIAESGTAGANAYKEAQTQNQQLQQGALAQASGSPDVSASLALNAASLASGKASFEADIARQGAANSSYMGQLDAAVPIVQERTRLGVEEIMAKAQAEREQRAMDKEMAMLSMQGQREQLAGQREARGAAAAERAAEAKNGGMSEYQREMLKRQDADDARADGDRTTKATAAAAAERDRKRGEALDSLNRRTGAISVDDKGRETIQATNGVKAISDVVNGYMTIDEALGAYKTPNKKQLDRGYLEREIAKILAIN